MTFAILLFAHLLADFPLQTNWVLRFKQRHWRGILFHALIHGLLTALLLVSPSRAWPLLLLLVALHFAIDWIKLNLPTVSETRGFLLDQLAHVLVLWLCSLAWPALRSHLSPPLLLGGILLALVPALMIFLAVRSIDQREASSPFWQRLWQRREQLILLSQWLGALILLSVAALQWLLRA